MAVTNLTCDHTAYSFYFQSKIQLNPDVAGPGVVIAYFSSAMLAVISIFVAYWTGSLPEAYYNDFDRAITYNKSGHLKIWKGVTKYPHIKRVQAFRQFVLILSDQQLVTGIGIMVGVWSRPESITFMDFQVATTLAWFSSTVHLITLVMLREYFQAYPSRYILRAVLMTIVLFLLISAIVVTAWVSGVNAALPLACLFTSSKIVPFGRDFANYPDPFTLLGMSTTITVLMVLFYSAILATADKSGRFGKIALISISRWLLNNSEARHLLRESRVIEGFFAFVRSEIDLRILASSSVWKFRFGSSLHLFLNSFWFQLVGVAYLLISGIAFIGFTYQWAEISLTAREFGYGQILPVLLLVLPFLTLIESIEDIRDEARKREDVGKAKDQISHETGPSEAEHRISTESTASLALQPMSIGVNREFITKEDEIKKSFPLEYLALTELADDSLAESKQTLLMLLSAADADRTAKLARHRNWFQFQAFLYTLYFAGLGVIAHLGANFLICLAPAYIPAIVIAFFSVRPYLKAFLALRQGRESDTKKRLLKLMRLTDRIAKEESSNAKPKDEPQADDILQIPAIQFPPRREWIV